MLILPEWNKPYILESLTSPVLAEYFWGFSATILDFTLLPINYLEETAGPSIQIQIQGTSIIIPASWNILVVDGETSYLDVVPLSNCSLNNYTALLVSPYDSKLRYSPIIIEDYIEDSLVHPMLPKASMMCYPIGPEVRANNEVTNNELSVCVGPYDIYSRYLNNKAVGDILG